MNVPACFELPELHVNGIENKHLGHQRFAETGEQLYGLNGHHASKHAGNCTENRKAKLFPMPGCPPDRGN